MKKLLMLLPGLFLLSTMTSCSDDDEEKASIVGRWQASKVEAAVFAEGIPQAVWEETDEDPDAIVEFRADGTVIVEKDGQTTQGAYEFEGDQLTSDITIPTDLIEIDGDFQVEELTVSELELYTEKDISGTLPDLGNVEGTARTTLYFTRL